MRRLFTFGCSFTRYKWPTWADILGAEFDLHENWGQLGAGNNYISNSVVECVLTRSIGPQDTVIVQWSGVLREDRYVSRGWVSVGNIFSKEQKVYDSNFVNNMIDIRGCYIRDLALMLMTKKILDGLGCQYKFISMSEIDEFADDDVADIIDFYQELLESIHPSMSKVLFNNDWNSRPWINPTHRDFITAESKYRQCAGPDWPRFMDIVTSNINHVPARIQSEIFDKNRWDWNIGKIRRCDGHPTPGEHLEYVDTVLSEFVPAQKTRDLVKEFDARVRAFETLPESWPNQFNITYPARW